MRHIVLALTLALTACSDQGPPADATGPAFDPIAFFTGKSHGEATLHIVFKGQRRLHVDSVGTLGPNKVLTLDQHIVMTGDKPHDRRWRLQATGPGRWGGTLKPDATGPVTVTAERGAIRIRYPMKNGLKVEQWLVPMGGGATPTALDNRMSVTFAGLPIASLHERIVKAKPTCATCAPR